MTETPTVTRRRLPTGRYVLVSIAFVLLLIGFVGRDYIPVGWLQKIRIGPMTLFPAVPQASQNVGLSTQPADSMAGMDHSNSDTPMAGWTATPTAPATSAGGVVTVLTLTPTSVATMTEIAPESTTTASTQEPAATVPQTATPVSTATVLPAKTLLPANTVPDVSAEKIRTDLEDLYRILQTTTVMTETFQRGQPTEAELTALKAQLNVIDQRMEELAAELRAIEADKNTQILLGQSSDLLELMRQAVGIVRSVWEGQTINSAILGQSQGILEQLLAMVGQLQELSARAQDTVETPPVASTATLSPTATLAPTATPTPAAVSSDQLDQMQTMLSQMIDQLSYMQSALDQKQAQPGTTLVP